MSRALRAIVLASALALAGCAGGAGGVLSAVGEVISYVKAGCSFVPTAASVEAILTKKTIIDTNFGIAQEICTAVTTLPLAEGPGQRTARVRGVRIRGKFVGR